MDVFKKNIKEIYSVFFIFALLNCVNYILKGNLLSFIVLMVLCVISNGWYWYAIRLFRGNENRMSAFKDALKCGGWIVLLEVVKTLIFVLMYVAVALIITLVLMLLTQNAKVLTFVAILIYIPVFVLTILSEFIYYDNRNRGIISAILTSISLVRKNYFKLLSVTLIVTVPYFLYIVMPLISPNISNSIAFKIVYGLINLILFPIFTFKLIEIYENLVVKSVETNDSLVEVAKALDTQQNDM